MYIYIYITIKIKSLSLSSQTSSLILAVSRHPITNRGETNWWNPERRWGQNYAPWAKRIMPPVFGVVVKLFWLLFHIVYCVNIHTIILTYTYIYIYNYIYRCYIYVYIYT